MKSTITTTNSKSLVTIASAVTVLVFVSLFFPALPRMHAQSAPSSILRLNDAMTANILPNGDASAKEVISMSALQYAQFKQNYPTISMMTRLFNPAYSDNQYVNLIVTPNDQNNSVVATYILQGISINQGGGNWAFQIPNSQGTSLTLSAQTANTMVFTWVLSVSANQQQIITATINFPSSATNLHFDSSTNTVTYSLAAPAPSSSGNIALLGGGIAMLVAGIGLMFFGRLSKRN